VDILWITLLQRDFFILSLDGHSPGIPNSALQALEYAQNASARRSCTPVVREGFGSPSPAIGSFVFLDARLEELL